MSAPTSGKSPLRSLTLWRRLIQFGVLLAFIVVPLLNLQEIHMFSGNLLAFHAAGVSLGDPLAALQVAAATLSAPAAMLAGAGLVLLPALVMGPVFCSWICPFGFLSELVHGIRKSASGKESGGKTTSPRPFAVKTLLAITGLFAAFLLGEPLLNQFSMPGWYTRIMQHALLYKQALFGGIAFLTAGLLLEAASGKRLWCRYLCPQSVLLSAAGMLFPKRLQVRFTPQSCSCRASDRPCLGACSLALNPRKPSPARQLQCTNCGGCVDACAKRGGALKFGFGKGR